MVKEEKKEIKSKVAVVTLGDYIGKVGNDVAGMDKVKAAVVLLYSENKVIAVLDRKGETLFVVEK